MAVSYLALRAESVYGGVRTVEGRLAFASIQSRCTRALLHSSSIEHETALWQSIALRALP